MVINCLDLNTGQVLHFPAGTYYKQTATIWRRTELTLMRTTWRAARIAYNKNNDPDRVSDEDMDFISWSLSKDTADEHSN